VRHCGVICVAAVALCISSCEHVGRSSSALGIVAESNSNDYISLVRHGCLGRCPGYTVTVHSDDTVHFEGRYYSSPAGIHVAPAAAGSYFHLLQQMEVMKFWTLEEDPDRPTTACHELVTDFPSVEIHVRAGGRSHSVTHYYGCIGLAEEVTIDKVAKAIEVTTGVATRARGVTWRAP
jgi:hypothetical protein